jgi:tetratricopeptide (TPR) repeat protein
MMSRRDDLEQRIRESYDIVREYEEIVQVSDRPEEVKRARHQIDEQWSRVREPLVQYLAICRRRGLAVPDDIAEIAATLGSELEEEVATYRLPLLSLPTGQGWIYGAAAVAVILLGVTVVLVGRLAGPAAAPEPSPTLTPLPPTETAMPTATRTLVPPTPIPSATLSFGQGTLYRVAIAEFDSQKASRQIEIVRRLEDDLRADLQASGLADYVEIRVVPDIIGTEDQAKDLASNVGSDVLIWGWYDDLGIRLYVLLGNEAWAGTPSVTGLRELPLGTVNGTSELSFYVHDVLPSNTTFLSMFVIGHLYYLSNNYAQGYQAFDAAMTNIPETVALENEALLHFFNARLMQTTTFTDPAGIVCEYAKAIELDPQLFEAYNNLGVLMMLITRPKYGKSCPDIYNDCYATTTYEQLPCVQAAGILSLEPADLFSQTLRVHPGWALARFNLAALHWNTLDTGYEGSVAKDVEEFEAVLDLDPTIAGAHIALGNMAVWEGDFELAVERFSAAMDLWPESGEVAVNLGQALALAGRDEEAIAAYQRALALTEEGSAAYREAHLVLGNLYHRCGNLDRAFQEYLLLEPTGDRAFDCTLSLALVKADIDAGAWVSATQRLETVGCWFLRGYLLWLVRGIQGTSEGDYSHFGDLECFDSFCAWTSGSVDEMLFCDLLSECYATGSKTWQDPTTWGNADTPCLPDDLEERLEVVYAKFQRWVHYRLFFNKAIMLSMGACPYVFTYDDQRHAWVPDTTIIYKLVGAEAEQSQARQLTRFDGRLWLRELGPETSYVDRLYVRVLTADGRWLVLALDDPALAADDGDYLILRQGDERLLTFDLPPDALPIQQAWVVAEGYYVPYIEEE